ncbi:MAG: LLM class flavin-dependent oxidoreductase, partial [Bacillus sp. (in: firmicutes)]
GNFPAGHEFAKVSASPTPKVSPIPWLLGTSQKSALLAAENGLPYAFGQFMSEKDGKEIIQQYLKAFKPRKQEHLPEVTVAISTICAETDERAEEVALSTLIWALQRQKGEGGKVPSIAEAKQYPQTDLEKESLEKMKEKMIIGNPQKVCQKLHELQAEFRADEIMIVTITHSPDDRIHSYKLIANEAHLL